MASAQMFELATRLKSDPAFRDDFRMHARTAVSELALSTDELNALDTVDWQVMSDAELVVRVEGALARPTTRTGP